MGRLKDFLAYIDDRRRLVSAVEAELCQLQEKYETFFSEVRSVREREYQQLSEHLIAGGAKVPAELRQALDRARQQAEREFDRKLTALIEEQRRAAQRCEALRKGSEEAEDKIRGRNTQLDDQEEKLKVRNEALLAQIEAHNQQIRLLAKGFGFFSNIFRMRALGKAGATLVTEQRALAERIEIVRQRWATAETEHHARETALQQQWIDDRAEASALQAKVDALIQARSRIIQRSALEQVLFDREPPDLAGDEQACPRCQVKNTQAAHFCEICAQRLVPDRPDLEGSLAEVAELNRHHRRFAAGMKAGQELIALMRGLASGLKAFRASVEGLVETESKHPLPKLELSVPQASVTYGQSFERVKELLAQDHLHHPVAFAEQVKGMMQQSFTEQQIKSYFETMGETLSAEAKRQWS
jgi:hypothetical protein